ncbi:MAG: hypothetical protein AAF518_15350 [Spirochaetota bacterium]
MQNKKLFDEIFKEMFKDILQKFYHLEVEYEIAGNPKHIDFYLEAGNLPINDRMVYLKIFQKYNLIEFKSEGDIFAKDDILKIHSYLSSFLLSNREKEDHLHYILICSIKPKLLFKRYHMEQIKLGIYYTAGFEIAPVYAVVISELPVEQAGEAERIRLFQQKNGLDSYLKESIVKQRDMKYAILLYREQVQRIAKELGLDMTAIEERAREIGWISVEEVEREKAKIRKLAEIRKTRWERRKGLQTAIRMKKKGCELK